MTESPHLPQRETLFDGKYCTAYLLKQVILYQ